MCSLQKSIQISFEVLLSYSSPPVGGEVNREGLLYARVGGGDGQDMQHEGYKSSVKPTLHIL